MNKTENLELRGITTEKAELREINVKDTFATATNYGFGSGYGSGSVYGSGGLFNKLLKTGSIETNSMYDYYTIDCPSDTRFLEIRFTLLPGSAANPMIQVTSDNYSSNKEYCCGTLGIRVKKTDDKHFRVYISDKFSTRVKMEVACYTCECAL